VSHFAACPLCFFVAGVESRTMNFFERPIVMAEALWARDHVKLAPEPPGARDGIVTAADQDRLLPRKALRLVAVGDSLVAGCGTADQADSLTPRIAARLSNNTERPVAWETHAKLGATMRRVRHRLLPEMSGHADVLFLSAGSNDILAGRNAKEWASELDAVLAMAEERATRTVLCSAGQLHNAPKLPRALRRELGRRMDEQTAISRELCASRGVTYIDVTHVPLVDGFWASDGFHPGPRGYEMAAELVVTGMQQAA